MVARKTQAENEVRAMNQREEEQYSVQQRISQEEPAPSRLVQIIVAFAFIGFIVGLPTIIDRLGK